MCIKKSFDIAFFRKKLIPKHVVSKQGKNLYPNEKNLSNFAFFDYHTAKSVKFCSMFNKKYSKSRRTPSLTLEKCPTSSTSKHAQPPWSSFWSWSLYQFHKFPCFTSVQHKNIKQRNFSDLNPFSELQVKNSRK